MKRLTFEGSFCDIAQCTDIPGGSFCEDGACYQRKVWERLKEYEDTGLTPEYIIRCRNCANFRQMRMAFAGATSTAARLRRRIIAAGRCGRTSRTRDRGGIWNTGNSRR